MPIKGEHAVIMSALAADRFDLAHDYVAFRSEPQGSKTDAIATLQVNTPEGVQEVEFLFCFTLAPTETFLETLQTIVEEGKEVRFVLERGQMFSPVLDTRFDWCAVLLGPAGFEGTWTDPEATVLPE